MKKIKYMFSKLKGLKIKKVFDVIEKIHIETKKSKIIIFFDMIICTLKYQAGYNDYYWFAMYNLNKTQRKTFLTVGKNNEYVKMFNPKEYWHLLDNKNEFNEKFNKYLKRDWLYLEGENINELKAFIKDKKVIIAKPNNDCGGKGIEKISLNDYKDINKLYNYLIDKKLLLLEEVVIQHKEMALINPASVNTIRLVTVYYNNKVNFIIGIIRIGNNNSFVDNISSGGMFSIIDLETGVIKYPAIDANKTIFKVHPLTKTKIEGIKIPYFFEALKIVEEMASQITELKYIAWDIAITEKGPVVIEGNPYPGYRFQFPIHTPNKIGLIPRFDIFLKQK